MFAPGGRMERTLSPEDNSSDVCVGCGENFGELTMYAPRDCVHECV